MNLSFSFTSHQHALGHTKQKTFTPSTHQISFSHVRTHTDIGFVMRLLGWSSFVFSRDVKCNHVSYRTSECPCVPCVSRHPPVSVYRYQLRLRPHTTKCKHWPDSPPPPPRPPSLPPPMATRQPPPARHVANAGGRWLRRWRQPLRTVGRDTEQPGRAQESIRSSARRPTHRWSKRAERRDHAREGTQEGLGPCSPLTATDCPECYSRLLSVPDRRSRPRSATERH